MADEGGYNNRVSSSKRLLMTDDDGNNHQSSSVHQVVFNDDFLIEILLRLPVISLLFFKSVSKRWLSLITFPAFVNLRLIRFPNIHPPSGLFLQQTNSTDNHFEHDFVSLDGRIPLGKKKSSFGCFGSDASNVEVLQSCNGLVLCVIRTNPTDRIYVYNPSLNMFKMLPPVHGLKLEEFLNQMRLAFDPSKSPHYKVLHIRLIVHEYNLNQPSIQTRIYSSETGSWRNCSNRYTIGWVSSHFDNVVYWDDAIHWLDIKNRVRHFKLEVEHPQVTTTKHPKTLDGNSYKELFESRGCLLLAFAAGPHHKRLKVFEMRNGYSGWSVRYIVKFEDSSIEAFLKTSKMSTMGFRFNVLSIVMGEREEGSFVVMNLNGKLVKYNLLSKTLHMLCDIDTHLTKFRTFPFIASFAGV